MILPPTSVPGPYVPPRRAVGASRGAPPSVARWHVVQPGESLWKISQRYYGNSSGWVRIFNANLEGRLRPDRTDGPLINTFVDPGTRLHIP